MRSRTRKQYIERWENVLRVLRSLTPHQRNKHWDMRKWGYQTECGFVCCAAGHCGMDPWFRKRGFIFEPAKSGTGPESTNVGWNGWTNKLPEEFFDYPGQVHIFSGERSRSVGEVIKEVRAHIKKLKAEL